VAGHRPDTTESQLAHGLRLFAGHPDQWDRLGEDPALAEQACQEVLRFEPVVPFTARLVREELELAGIIFPVGTVIFVCAATANRDPLTYADPGRFDIMADRGGAQVVTFGFGAHFCAGASLARAEIIEALAFLAPRMRDLKPDGEPVFGTPTGIYAMRSLPVRFTPHEPRLSGHRSRVTRLAGQPQARTISSPAVWADPPLPAQTMIPDATSAPRRRPVRATGIVWVPLSRAWPVVDRAAGHTPSRDRVWNHWSAMSDTGDNIQRSKGGHEAMPLSQS